MSYYTKSPVLFLIFNRPDYTVRVFEKIREAAPARLYIAADGPRQDVTGEDERCRLSRKIVENIDWPCEVRTLYRKQHLGCKEAVAEAVTWFFENEEEGIILEDDCLPANSFFRFCDEMLNRYRGHVQIRHIGGSNLQQQKWGDGSYYFSNLTHAWGWASWRRVWLDYDKDLKEYDAADLEKQLRYLFTEPVIVEQWLEIFERLKSGHINTWDYQLTFINFIKGGLSVIPNVNLISNIGFGADATHTFDPANRYANLPVNELSGIIHPAEIKAQTAADLYTLMYDFNVERIKHKRRRIDRRIKRWFKQLLA